MECILSILHISDLHRNHDLKVTNQALLTSLRSDRNRYTEEESPKIKEPDIIIVSGDIISGSSGPTDPKVEIKKQYQEAKEFLTDLAREFLGGDKGRIVIIPGNHDIDWSSSKGSMTKIESKKVLDENDNLKWAFFNASINQTSKIRWSWKELAFYEITDVDLYNSRLALFAEFYSDFYDGKRSFSLRPEDQLDLFDFPTFNVSIAAFTTCFSNDHLRLVGDIHPDCIAKMEEQLRPLKRRGRLLLATWHHNTKGLPYDSNYMDHSRLKNFIDAGITLGFHGHQHKTEVIHEYSSPLEQKRIVIFSAGTLCGGRDELPIGHNRQYNLVEVFKTTSTEKLTVTLHVREKTDSSSLENPIWTPGRIDSKLVSHYSIEIDRPVSKDNMAQLIQVESLINSKDYPGAKVILKQMDTSDPFVRSFLVEYILQAEDHDLALETLKDPKNAAECIVVLNAAKEKKNKQVLPELIQKATPYAIGNAILTETIKKTEAILK